MDYRRFGVQGINIKLLLKYRDQYSFVPLSVL